MDGRAITTVERPPFRCSRAMSVTEFCSLLQPITHTAKVDPSFGRGDHHQLVTTHLICSGCLSRGVVKRPPGWVLGGRFWLAGQGWVGWSACRCRRAVRLICAGWLPQDGLFGWNASAGLEIERDPQAGLRMLIGVPRVVPRAATTAWLSWPDIWRSRSAIPGPPGTSTSRRARGRSRRWR